MWTNNLNVIRTYASSHSKNAWAIVSSISGWKKIQIISNDGVTNCNTMLNIALANDRKVDVYIESDQIQRVVMR